MKTDQEIGKDAAAIARREVIRVAKDTGVTLERTMIRLKQALNAKETKFFQKDGFVLTEIDVVAHGTRLTAVKIALELYDAMPSKKHDLETVRPVEIVIREKDLGIL